MFKFENHNLLTTPQISLNWLFPEIFVVQTNEASHLRFAVQVQTVCTSWREITNQTKNFKRKARLSVDLRLYSETVRCILVDRMTRKECWQTILLRTPTRTRPFLFESNQHGVKMFLEFNTYVHQQSKQSKLAIFPSFFSFLSQP